MRGRRRLAGARAGGHWVSLDVIDCLGAVASELEAEAVAAEEQLCALRHRLDDLGRVPLAKAEDLNGVWAYW